MRISWGAQRLVFVLFTLTNALGLPLVFYQEKRAKWCLDLRYSTWTAGSERSKE